MLWQTGENIVAKGCTEKYTCHATGAVTSEPLTCPAEEYCGVKDGVRGCQKKEGTCTVKPGAHLHSFDGMEGKISSGGAFEISSLCNQSSEEWFRVVVDVRTCTRNSIAGAVTVYVFFGNTYIAVNNEHETWVRRPSTCGNWREYIGIAAENCVNVYGRGAKPWSWVPPELSIT